MQTEEVDGTLDNYPAKAYIPSPCLNVNNSTTSEVKIKI